VAVVTLALVALVFFLGDNSEESWDNFEDDYWDEEESLILPQDDEKTAYWDSVKDEIEADEYWDNFEETVKADDYWDNFKDAVQVDDYWD
jgi:hypothetical protein